MSAWGHDLRYAARGLAATPGFTIVALLTLGLGIGANTAIFSLLDQALLQPLPVNHPEQLRLAVVKSRTGAMMSNAPAEFFQELRRERRAFAGVLACWQTEMNFDTSGDAERVLVQYVSGGYYATLGVPVFLGRAISEADEDADRPVVILSHRFWMQRFAGDPGALGQTVYVNRLPATVVGVMPPQFFGIDRGVSPDLTVPLPRRSPFANLWIMVRLRPEAGDREGEDEAELALERALETIRPSLSKYRASDRDAILTQRAELLPAATGVGAALSGYVDPLRVLLLLASGLLLIACVNVANLLLARALARNHEFGVRLAVGASRGRLIRQVLAESVLLAVLGSCAAAPMAALFHRSLVRLLMDDLAHRALDLPVNLHLFAFSAGVCTITVVISGILPALRATRVDIGAVLQASARRGRTGQRQIAKGLVTAQVAAAFVLLLGAGLLNRSLLSLSALNTGVALDRILTMRIGLSARETQQIESTQAYTELVRRVELLPGVSSVALGWDSALGSGRSQKSIWIEGQPSERSQSAGLNVVGPHFFATAGIPVVLGREFTNADNATSPKVVVVNEAWARRYAAGRNPIGLHMGDAGAASIGKYEVIGVVRDSLTMALRRPAEPMIYEPLLQDAWASNVVLHVRTGDDPWLMQDPVRAVIRTWNPRVPVYDITTLTGRRDVALGQDHVMAVLSKALGALALLLTALGIYGLIAYSVAQRTVEFGIRMALGASRGSIHRLVAGETLRLISIGVAVGVPLSLAAARLIESSLFRVGPHDPLTLFTSLALLLIASLFAAYCPRVEQPASSPRWRCVLTDVRQVSMGYPMIGARRVSGAT